MTESVKFYWPRRTVVRMYAVAIPLSLVLAVVGFVAHRQNPGGAISITAWVGAAVCVYILVRCLSPCIWVTAEGIFHPPFMNRSAYRWNEPVQVMPSLSSGGVFLMGDLKAPRNFPIPEFVVTDPAFRAALVRWAPPGYALLVYLSKAA